MPIPEGFKRADTEIIYRMIVGIEALEKSGKSNFIFTAPGPIAYFNFDKPVDDVVWKFADKKVIYVRNYWPDDASQAAHQKVMSDFLSDYIMLLNENEVRTLAIDTGTKLWEVARMAEFGKVSQVSKYAYGPLNAQFNELINKAYKSDKSLIVSHKKGKEYVDDMWKGGYERKGFGDMNFLTQINIELSRDDVDPFDFHLKVLDSAYNSSLKGLELDNDMVNFPMLASLVFNNDIAMWE